jgi:hypothetical protein
MINTASKLTSGSEADVETPAAFRTCEPDVAYHEVFKVEKAFL